jgi:hypothetical protein
VLRSPSDPAQSKKPSFLGRNDIAGPRRKPDNAKVAVALAVGPDVPYGIGCRTYLGKLIACAPHPLASASECVPCDVKGLIRINPDPRQVDKISSVHHLPRIERAFCLGELSSHDRDAVEGIFDEETGLSGISRQHIPSRGIWSSVVRRNPHDLFCEVARQRLHGLYRPILRILGERRKKRESDCDRKCGKNLHVSPITR